MPAAPTIPRRPEIPARSFLPALAALFAFAAAISIGEDAEAITWLLSGAGGLVYALGVVFVWFLAALGWGELAGGALLGRRRALAGSRLALGLALQLWLLHAVGSLGLMNTAGVWLVLAPGVVALALRLRRTRPQWLLTRVNRAMCSPWSIPIALAIGLWLAAATLMPGLFWSSEFGAYDALSYHLQLPQEWLESERVAPPAHNVYAFLPSYMETAFASLGAMSFAPNDARFPGLLVGGGWRLVAAHLLHAGFALVTARLLADAVQKLAARCALSTPSGVGPAVGLAFFATPWILVVGTLAYNELAVTALAAGAMTTAVAASGWRRAIACGLLVGVACGVKPTALFFVTPVVGLLMLWRTPARSWPTLVGLGAVAGLAAIAPWLLRNALHAGNPVFPFATDLFGAAHWGQEQIGRWNAAHRLDADLIDRLRIAILIDPSSRAADPSVVRWRGPLNPQWALLTPAVLAGLAALVARRGTRTLGLLFIGGLGAALLAWLFLTHVQSRFLIPLAPLGIAALGVACAASRYGRWSLLGLGLLQLAFSAALYAGQLDGSPNRLRAIAPAVFLGTPYSTEIGDFSPTAYVNNELRDGSRLLLVGRATPLYFAIDTVYATTWDEPPLLALKSGELEDVTHVLADYAELARLESSGYLDPDLRPESVARWLEANGRLVKAWPEARTALYRLDR